MFLTWNPVGKHLFGNSQTTISQKTTVLRLVTLIHYTLTGILKFAGVREFNTGLRYSHLVIYRRSA